jgi:hypothetical protein
MYSYGQVESALMRVHQIPTNAKGAFRAQIKHFQKIRIVTSSPGKGRRIEYSVHDVLLWGFALELAQFGIDPADVKRIIFSRELDALFAIFDQKPERDIFFFFHPTLLSTGFPDDARRSIDNPWGAPNYLLGLFAPASYLPELDTRDPAAGAFNARLGVINVSRMRRRIEMALDAITRAHTANSKNHESQ